MNARIPTTVTVLITLASMLTVPRPSRLAAAGPPARKPPDFTLKAFHGPEIGLSDYRGKIVVLEWFNDECPFVRYHYEKANTMIELARKYKDKNVAWLTVNSTSHTTAEQNKDFAGRYKLAYPILDDRLGTVGRAYGARSTPHMFVVNAEGNIVYDGAIDNSPLGRNKERVVNYVDKALAELTGGKTVGTPTTKPYGCSVKYGRAPAFTLTTFDRKTISLSDYNGKIVVLEWFNDECPFVRYHYEKANTMVQVAKKYADKNVVWLAINSTSHTTPEQNRAFANKHELPYPILDDSSGTVGRAYGARSTPHMYILDAKGGIVYTGAIDNSPLGRKKEGVINYVDTALAELTGNQALSIPSTRPYGCSVKYAR
ncbi:MAG: redoxin domain-containing protein [Planctomycetota bacterium]|jgi:peroxiredoxin